jgi:hypothetical protein
MKTRNKTVKVKIFFVIIICCDSNSETFVTENLRVSKIRAMEIIFLTGIKKCIKLNIKEKYLWKELNTGVR